MGFGLTFKVAPGIRIRASSRGLRTSLGPRAARIHIGGGPTRVSSGFGPLTASTTLGTQQPSHRSASTRWQAPRRPVSLATLQREAAAAERAETIRNVMQIEHALTTLHLHDFVPVTRPVLPPPHPPNVAALIEARERQALDGISVFERSKRREATEWAQQAGQRDAQAQWAEAQQTHADQQAVQDELWHKLIAHHEPTVHDALEDAFEDNQSPAACIDVGKDFTTHAGARYATVLIVFGPLDLVPERRPAVTPTGKPTLHKRTKAERNDFYIKALGSTILATVKEGLAVAPSLTEIRVVVVRKRPQCDER